MHAGLYAVRPKEGYFKVSDPGTVSVLDDGRTTFTPSPNGKHRHLIFDPAQKDRIVKTYTDLVSAKPVEKPARSQETGRPQEVDTARLALRIRHSPMRAILVAVLLLFQSPPVFEVASVKQSSPGGPAGAKLDAAHFIGTGLTLRSLIFSVYRIPPWRLSGGPAWLDTDEWDIAATLPPNMPTKREELTPLADQMVQALLADRFKLATHREMRDQPVYDLVVAKSGLKMMPSTAGKFAVKMLRGHLELHDISMERFISYLYSPPPYEQQSRVDRPVLDKTGLKGFYDLTLDWNDEAGPSIFTALEEQAGLKLEPRKAPVEFLVIDRVEKPAGN